MFFSFVLALAVSMSVWFLIRRAPRRDYDPQENLAILPHITRSGNTYTIHNMRDTTYTDGLNSYTPQYVRKTFMLEDITRLWLAHSTFWDHWKSLGKAHMILSFELKDGTCIAISPELRHHKGQEFSWSTILKSMLHLREIMYVVATERDVFSLRLFHSKDPLYLFAFSFPPESVQCVWTSIADHIMHLETNPEFFDSVRSNCTTHAMHHVRVAAPQLPRFHWLYMLPRRLTHLLHTRSVLHTSPSTEHPIEPDNSWRTLNDLAFSHAIRTHRDK